MAEQGVFRFGLGWTTMHFGQAFISCWRWWRIRNCTQQDRQVFCRDKESTVPIPNVSNRDNSPRRRGANEDTL